MKIWRAFFFSFISLGLFPKVKLSPRTTKADEGEMEFPGQRMASVSFTLFPKIKFLPRNAEPEDEEMEFA